MASQQLKLIKIGARVVRHARAITFQLAKEAVTGPMVRAILVASTDCQCHHYSHDRDSGSN